MPSYIYHGINSFSRFFKNDSWPLYTTITIMYSFYVLLRHFPLILGFPTEKIPSVNTLARRFEEFQNSKKLNVQ